MIDKDIHDRLRQEYNPDGSQLRLIQLRLLEMLKFIDQVCRKYDIPYWLSSGTCLGAVRHGGFIPWDDDVDIEMLDDDYKKFLTVIGAECNNRYVMHCHETDPMYLRPFGKLRDLNSEIKENCKADYYNKYHGLYIDIFPLKESSSELVSKLGGILLKYIAFGIPMLYWGKVSKYILSRIGWAVIKTYERLAYIIELPLKNRYLRHKYPNYYHFVRIQEDIFPLKEIQFENGNFFVPGNVDGYLSKIYGDYNQLPGKEEINYHIKNVEVR